MYRTRTNTSPSFGSGMSLLDILKCSGPSFPLGFSTSKTWRLTLSFMAFPPLVCRFLMQLVAVEALNCPHCSLDMTLVGGRSFHNGKIVANALTFEACCVA